MGISPFSKARKMASTAEGCCSGTSPGVLLNIWMPSAMARDAAAAATSPSLLQGMADFLGGEGGGGEGADGEAGEEKKRLRAGKKIRIRNRKARTHDLRTERKKEGEERKIASQVKLPFAAPKERGNQMPQWENQAENQDEAEVQSSRSTWTPNPSSSVDGRFTWQLILGGDQMTSFGVVMKVQEAFFRVVLGKKKRATTGLWEQKKKRGEEEETRREERERLNARVSGERRKGEREGKESEEKGEGEKKRDELY